MTAATSYFRRPTYRAPSPPTWACYEQIPRERGSYSDSDDSCSDSDSCDSECDDDEENDDAEKGGNASDDVQNMDMDIEADANTHVRRTTDDEDAADVETVLKADVKGKQRAIDPVEPEVSASPKVVHKRSPRKHREPVYDPRPILTIHKSQGFVWNQDLFVPAYAKDRYVASTSPPNAKGFIPGSCSSNDSSLGGYEVEVVEIRVKEGEFDDILY